MFAFTDTQLIGMINSYFLPFVRISAFLMAAPIFGTKIVSVKIRLILSITLTLIVAPLITNTITFSGINLSMMLIILQQILIGVALAFIFQVVFQVFVLSGQYIAMKLGLGFASMNDPSNGVSVTIVSQFYLLTTTLLFLSVNGHLMTIQILVDSFTVVPIGVWGFTAATLYKIVGLGSWMFASALTISLPVLTALLVVNIAFGVMSRSAPQMNIFAVGFPVTLLFGLMIMWVGFSAFLTNFDTYVHEGMSFTMNLLNAN
jgi:flagellar biosynthetic protein FliR